MSGVPFMTGGGSNAFARYVHNTQTQANTNNCSNGTNCAITSPQTQGDGTANSPVSTQISISMRNKKTEQVLLLSPLHTLHFLRN
jgi:hypothetical protein